MHLFEEERRQHIRLMVVEKNPNFYNHKFSIFQFAGTLSDGLGKTMDTRHQSEREYIRYHGATSGEHLVAGIHGLAHGMPYIYKHENCRG